MREAPGPARGGDARELVDLTPGQVPQTTYRKAPHGPATLDRATKYLEPGAADGLRDVLDLEPEAQVRLVRAVSGHRLRERHARERFLEDFLLRVALDDLGEQALHEGEDLFLGRVAHLDIELRVLGLAVAALVLVA